MDGRGRTWLCFQGATLAGGLDPVLVNTWPGYRRGNAVAVVVSWPKEATGFNLESALVVQPPIEWQQVTEPVVTVGEEQTVTLSLITERRYFRLWK